MTYAPWLAPAVERLDTLIDEGSCAIGAQLWVCLDGEVVCDLALGDSVAGLMTTGTVHNNYCLGKPIVALALARMAADGAVDLDAPLGDLDLPDWAVPGFECTVLDVLDHQVGLDTLAAMEYRVSPGSARAELVRERIAAAERRPAYSEILGGLILEEVIRSATGCGSIAHEVLRRVADPDSADGPVLDGPGSERLCEAGAVSVPFGGLPDRRIPLLFEMLPQSFADVRPAFGVLCSARSIGRVLDAARTELLREGSASGAMLARMLRQRHPPFDDERATRMVVAAGGFMVDAALNQLAPMASPRSFGHNAGMAQSVVLTDPEAGLTVSLYLNGAEVGSSSHLDDRLALMDDIYRALDSA